MSVHDSSTIHCLYWYFDEWNAFSSVKQRLGWFQFLHWRFWWRPHYKSISKLSPEGQIIIALIDGSAKDIWLQIGEAAQVDTYTYTLNSIPEQTLKHRLLNQYIPMGPDLYAIMLDTLEHKGYIKLTQKGIRITRKLLSHIELRYND